jgi:hypothetical protein
MRGRRNRNRQNDAERRRACVAAQTGATCVLMAFAWLWRHSVALADGATMRRGAISGARLHFVADRLLFCDGRNLGRCGGLILRVTAGAKLVQ